MRHNGRSSYTAAKEMWCVYCHAQMRSSEAVSVPRASDMPGHVRQRRGWAHIACRDAQGVVP